MTPAEELRAAADRLEALAKAATPGHWAAGRSDDPNDVPLVASDGHAWEYLCCSPDDGVRGGHTLPDAELVVAMRATVEPLVVLLRAVADNVDFDSIVRHEQEALAIARATPGGAS